MRSRTRFAAALVASMLGMPAAQAGAAQPQVWVLGERNASTPVVEDFGIDVSVPSGRRLARVWLELSDNEMPGPDPSVVVFGAGAVGEGIDVRSSRGRHAIRFPLPLWDTGRNSLTVHAVTIGTDGPRTHSARREFRWTSTRDWATSSGGTRFAPPGVPPRATGCPFVFCKDADRDGLLDLWENLAAKGLRPLLVPDEAEDFREHADHDVRTFVRVTLVDRGANILFRFATAFTRDYGDPLLGLGGHDGDVSTAQALWRLEGDALQLQWVRANRHLGGWAGPLWFPPYTEDWVRRADSLRFDGEGILKLWLEEDKHGLWWSNEACEDDGPYDCNGGRMMRPVAVNAGEPDDRFLDELDRLRVDGPFGLFGGVFAGERVWSPRTDGRSGFCGGLRGDGGCGNHLGDALKILSSEHPRHGDDDPALVTPGRAR